MKEYLRILGIVSMLLAWLCVIVTLLIVAAARAVEGDPEALALGLAAVAVLALGISVLAWADR